jgi:glycerol-3-phosphate acyltransferase PlsY
MIIDGIFIISGYVLGSISSAIIVSRVLGLPDPRTQGSRNPGATNVLRLGGKRAAAVVFAGDCLKGLLPVLLARSLGASDWGLAGSALAAFLGHLYPAFFGFEGGKGVATAFGAILGLSPGVALCTLITWLLMALAVRISSLSALAAAVLSPFYLWWFNLPWPYVAAVLIMIALLIWRHRSNVRNLLAGSEGRIGGDKS